MQRISLDLLLRLAGLVLSFRAIMVAMFHTRKTYADVYAGVRQDSGDPALLVKIVRDFYNNEGITNEKSIIYSDALNIDKCL